MSLEARPTLIFQFQSVGDQLVLQVTRFGKVARPSELDPREYRRPTGQPCEARNGSDFDWNHNNPGPGIVAFALLFIAYKVWAIDAPGGADIDEVAFVGPCFNSPAASLGNALSNPDQGKYVEAILRTPNWRTYLPMVPGDNQNGKNKQKKPRRFRLKGIRPGDVHIEVDGKWITSKEDLAGLANRLLSSGRYTDPNPFVEDTSGLAAGLVSPPVPAPRPEPSARLPELVDDYVPRPRLVAEVDRFIAEADSGYLVISGEMGLGKTTAMHEVLRHRKRFSLPVFHYLKGHGSDSSQPRRIAESFCRQLLAKYRLAEPADWAQTPAWEHRLEHLLDRLSQDEQLLPQGGKEVLFLEAADQADLEPGQSLVPHAICRLPPRILGVMTTRPNMQWLGLLQQVVHRRFSELVDDGEAVAAHLRGRGGRLKPPLEEGLIRQITADTNRLPVFFTVNARLEQLEGRRQRSHYSDEELRRHAPAWLVPPEDLIKEERRRIFSLAAREPNAIDEDDAWRVLGLMAVAGEDLSPSQLKALGFYGPQARKLLKLSVNFFEPRPFEPKDTDAFVFAKAGYQREILDHFDAAGLRELNRLYARACQNCWPDQANAAHGYSLRHLPYHLARADRPNQLAALLLDVRFLAARIGVGRNSEGDLHELQGTSIYDVLHNLNLAVSVVPSGSPLRLELEQLRRVLDLRSDFLAVHPDRLLEVLQHERPWAADCPRLGRSLAKALAARNQTWLKRANWLEDCRQGSSRKQTLASSRAAALLRTMGGPPISPPVMLAFTQHGHHLVACAPDGTTHQWEVSTGGPALASEVLDHFIDLLPIGRFLRWFAQENDHIHRLCESCSTSAGPRPGLRLTLRDLRVGCHDQSLIGEIQVQITVGASATDLDSHVDATFSRVAFVVGTNSIGVAKAVDSAIELAPLASHPWTIRNAHGGPVRTMAFSDDGNMLASAGGDNTVRWWRTDGSEPDGHLLSGSRHVIETLFFSPDRRDLLAIDAQEELLVWNIQTGACRHYGMKARTATVARNGQVLVLGTPNGRLEWRTIGEYYRGLTLQLCPGPIVRLACSADGQNLATVDDEGRVRIWNLPVPEPSRMSLLPPVPSQTSAANRHPVEFAAAFSRDGRTFAFFPSFFSSTNITMGIVDTLTGWCQLAGTLHLGTLPAFTPDSRTIAVCRPNRPIEILMSVPDPTPWKQPIPPFPLSGRWYAAKPPKLLLKDEGGRLRRNANGKPLVKRTPTDWPTPPVIEHAGEKPSSFAFCGARFLAVSYPSLGIRLYDLTTADATGRPLTAPEESRGCYLVASPDGQFLAGACEGYGEPRNYMVFLWSIETGGCCVFLHDHIIYPVLSFAPDRNLVSVTAEPRCVVFIDPATGRREFALEVEEAFDPSSSACPFYEAKTAFCPGGRFFALGYRTAVTLFDTRFRVTVGRCHLAGAVQAMAFLQGGRHLAVLSKRNTLEIFDTEKFKLVHQFEQAGASVIGLWTDPLGNRLILALRHGATGEVYPATYHFQESGAGNEVSPA